MTLNTQTSRIIDPVLTETAQGYKHKARVGHYLFPKADVSQRGGTILEFGKESFRMANSRRAPGGNTQRVQIGYAGKPFNLVQDALDGQVPREHLQDAEQVPHIDLGMRAVGSVMDNMTLGLEYEQAQIATNPENFADKHKLDLTTEKHWNDPTSNPLDIMDKAKEQVRLTAGCDPNVFVISKPVFIGLKNHPTIKDQFKYTTAESITTNMLAAYFDLEKLAVGRSVMLDSPDEDAKFIDVWGNSGILAYAPVEGAGFEEPSFGYTYTLKGHPFVEKPRYDGDTKSWLYGVTYERLPVLTGASSGFLFQNVIGESVGGENA